MKRDLLIIAVLLAIGLSQNLAWTDSTPFHPDETRWLNRGRYIQELLAPGSLDWSDHFLTRGQPPAASYVMGLGLLAQGRPLEPNKIWHFSYGTLWNIRNDNMPIQTDLEAGRRTNAVLGAIAVVLVYLLGQRLTNRLGGIIGALVLAYHPLMNEVSSMALSDTFLVLTLALSALAGCWLAVHPTWLRALLLGGLLGLGASAKLSPLLLVVPLAALGAFLLARPHLRWRPLRADPDPASRLLGLWLLSLPVVTFTVFVVSYPYLWPDPIRRTYYLFAFRTREMGIQAENWPGVAIDSRRQALDKIWTMLGEYYSVAGRLADASPSFSFLPLELDLILALLGGAVLLWLIALRGLSSPQALAGVILFGQAALIFGGLRVDYARYYLPLVFVIAVGIGVLAGFVGMTASELVRRSRRQVPLPAAPQ